MRTDQENALAFTNLEDDTVKLVAYTIVSLKRDQERIMEGGQESVIVTDSMKGDAFASWILAKYLQEEVTTPDGTVVSRGALIDPDELRYLRVYYVVSNRWPREPAEFEERQIEVLQGIQNAIS